MVKGITNKFRVQFFPAFLKMVEDGVNKSFLENTRRKSHHTHNKSFQIDLPKSGNSLVLTRSFHSSSFQSRSRFSPYRKQHKARSDWLCTV